MQQPWTAECVVSADLAAALIESQFPVLAPARVEPLGVGWDNTVHRINDRYIFRFPRRRIAVGLLRAEQRLLPLIAPRVPLRVPVPVFAGEPTSGFQWPFAGYEMVPGRTACGAALDVAQRTRAAQPLARFLRALHAIPVDQALHAGATGDTFGRLELSKRLPLARDKLRELEHRKLIDDCTPLRRIIAEIDPDWRPRETSVVHGDLYVRHLMVDDEGALVGVIDWGDAHVGDAAVDLAVAHAFLPRSAHAVFRAAYGPIDDATWRAARFRALYHTSVTTLYALDVDDRELLREGNVALGHLAAAGE